MKFRSTHKTLDLNFSLGKTAYTVEPEGECEIDECWVATVKARGLMLEEAPAVTAKEPEKAAPEKPAQKSAPKATAARESEKPAPKPSAPTD